MNNHTRENEFTRNYPLRAPRWINWLDIGFSNGLKREFDTEAWYDMLQSGQASTALRSLASGMYYYDRARRQLR